jgi:hypothetical protein
MSLLLEKKQTNITDYLISMIQIENMVRFFELDQERIKKHLKTQSLNSEEMMLAYKACAKDVSNEIKLNHLKNNEHIEEINSLISRLSSLNIELIRSDRTYREMFDQAKIYIQKASIQYGEGETNPVLLAFISLSKAKKTVINSHSYEEMTIEGLSAIKDIVSYLGYKFHQRKAMV